MLKSKTQIEQMKRDRHKISADIDHHNCVNAKLHEELAELDHEISTAEELPNLNITEGFDVEWFLSSWEQDGSTNKPRLGYSMPGLGTSSITLDEAAKLSRFLNDTLPKMLERDTKQTPKAQNYTAPSWFIK